MGFLSFMVLGIGRRHSSSYECPKLKDLGTHVAGSLEAAEQHDVVLVAVALRVNGELAIA